MQNQGFYDFHTHTVFSDGGMIPAGLMQRAIVCGCMGLAITDHVDSSNLVWAFENVRKFVEDLGQEWRLDIVPGTEATTAPLNKLGLDQLGKNWHLPVIPGVELTSVPPRKIATLAEQARSLGAQWIVVHGETIMEPVAPGTNRAAIEAQVDLLSHPGLITPEDAARAAELGVYLEITTHKGHGLANGWVAKQAREVGAKLLVNTDCHISAEILDAKQRRAIAMGAGLTSE
jgi:putative hydrolase